LTGVVDAIVIDDSKIGALSVEALSNLLKYFLEPRVEGVSKMRRAELAIKVQEKLPEYKNRAAV
jgi:hypothetical protein